MPGQLLFVPDGALDQPTPADITPRARKGSMDKSVPPNEHLPDAPTVKTEPTRPATEGSPPTREDAASQSAQVASPQEPPTEPTATSPAETPAATEPPASSPLETSPAAATSPAEPATSAPWSLSAEPAAPTPAQLNASPEWRPLIQRIDKEQVGAFAWRAGKVGVIVFAGWFIAVVVLIAVFRFVNPPFSTLMAMQWLGGTQIKQQWEPIEDISPNLVRAVIASEDGRFCRHWGIDFVEVWHAIERSDGGIPRGASTISMQVAKNLFLWPSKSYIRKAIEVPVTYSIELLWTKRRIMEVYLNIAEWGPGVFGAQAASEAHFGRSASRLSSAQAARLAVALPNPIIRDAGDPGPWTRRHAGVIQRRAAASPENAACVLSSR